MVLAVMTATLLDLTLRVGSGPSGRIFWGPRKQSTTKRQGQEPRPVGRRVASMGPPKACGEIIKGFYYDFD